MHDSRRQRRMTPLQVAPEDVGTCFRHHGREPCHKTLARDPQRHRQTGSPYSLVFRNIHTTQTQKRAGKPTEPSRRNGQRHTVQTRSLLKPLRTPSVQERYQSVPASASLVDSQATWVDMMGAHAEAIEHSTSTNKLGGPSAHEFSGKHARQ